MKCFLSDGIFGEYHEIACAIMQHANARHDDNTYFDILARDREGNRAMRHRRHRIKASRAEWYRASLEA